MKTPRPDRQVVQNCGLGSIDIRYQCAQQSIENYASYQDSGLRIMELSILIILIHDDGNGLYQLKQALTIDDFFRGGLCCNNCDTTFETSLNGKLAATLRRRLNLHSTCTWYDTCAIGRHKTTHQQSTKQWHWYVRFFGIS
jgi:hypothetical protein